MDSLVFSMLLSEDEVDNELTDLPGLQDKSEIDDDDSDEETAGPPMQPSNPNTPNTYTSASQSSRGTKRQRQSPCCLQTKKHYSV